MAITNTIGTNMTLSQLAVNNDPSIYTSNILTEPGFNFLTEDNNYILTED